MLPLFQILQFEIKLFKEKRNAIQDQVRQLISQVKGRRGEKNEKRSATAEFAQLKQEVDHLERTFETSSVGAKKEKEMMASIKSADLWKKVEGWQKLYLDFLAWNNIVEKFECDSTPATK